MSENSISYKPPDSWRLWKEYFGNNERPTTPFSTYSEFMHFDSYPEKQRGELVSFLEELYSISGDGWKPGGCTSIETIASFAHDILIQKGGAEYPNIKNMRIKQYIVHHFWIELSIDGIKEPVIVDPTGVPQDPRMMDENIKPFFGPIEAASGFAKTVYTNKKKYAGTTSSFPPGFHP